VVPVNGSKLKAQGHTFIVHPKMKVSKSGLP